MNSLEIFHITCQYSVLMFGEIFALCLDLTSKMQSMEICKPFSKPIDPVEDHCVDYLQIIKKPMDLETIIHKLNANQYKNIESWIEDVEQIWKNALLYNDEESFIYCMALDMQCWFRKKVTKIPHKTEEEWYLDLKKATDHLCFTLSVPPT